MERIGKNLSTAILGAVLYAALSFVSAERAEAQCLIGPTGTAAVATGSYFVNYGTCSLYSAQARAWVDTVSGPGRWRHGAAQHTCGVSGSYMVRLITNRVNAVTGAVTSSENKKMTTSCLNLNEIVHQNVSGDLHIISAQCRISVGC